MFYYFGRKKRLAGLYPKPLHDAIIEPFAGSAAYSLHGDYWMRDVTLIEKDPAIASLWRYLMSVQASDILALPPLSPGESLASHSLLTPDERLLISLHIGPGKNRTNDVVSKFSRWPAGQRYVAASVDKVRHWTLIEGSCLDSNLVHSPATWFVDPPYQRSGKLYRCGAADINFGELADWTQSLKGQVIACEQDGANWLPFEHLSTIATAGRNYSKEYVWTNNSASPEEEEAA